MGTKGSDVLDSPIKSQPVTLKVEIIYCSYVSLCLLLSKPKLPANTIIVGKLNQTEWQFPFKNRLK